MDCFIMGIKGKEELLFGGLKLFLLLLALIVRVLLSLVGIAAHD